MGASATDIVVKLLGDASGFAGAMKKAQLSAATTGQKMKAAMTQASAGAAVALAAVFAVVAKSIATYAEYGKSIKTVMRITGATSEAASTLVGQWRLSGVAAEKGAAGMKFLSKAMYAARDAGSAQAKVFQTLGIGLKDSNGKWIASADIMRQVRDRMAGMSDATERTALAVQLFGKGGAELLPWLTKSNAEIDKQTKLLKSLGLVWTAQDMKKWGDLASAQRTLSVTMTALQIHIADAAVPLLTKLLPGFTALTGVLVKIPTPVFQVVAGFLALVVAMNGILKVKGILEGFGILKGLVGVPAMLGRVAGGFTSATVAESAFSGASGTLGGKMRNLSKLIVANVVALGPYVIAIAAVTVAVWKTVEAIQGWRQAEKNLQRQRADNLAQEAKTLDRIAEKYGRNSKEYRKMVTLINADNAQMNQMYKNQLSGLADWIDSWIAGIKMPSWIRNPLEAWLTLYSKTSAAVGGVLGMASGGYVAPRLGGTPVILGEGGQGEYVIPASKMGAMGGGSTFVNVSWQTLTGEPSEREKRQLVRRLKPEFKRLDHERKRTGF